MCARCCCWTESAGCSSRVSAVPAFPQLSSELARGQLQRCVVECNAWWGAQAGRLLAVWLATTMNKASSCSWGTPVQGMQALHRLHRCIICLVTHYPKPCCPCSALCARWAGRFTLLLGPPGSGKSVLMKALAGLASRDESLKASCAAPWRCLEAFASAVAYVRAATCPQRG